MLLLDELIARASGMPADAFRRAALYEPLGLAATTARPHEGSCVPDLAEPYVPDGARRVVAVATDLLGIAADTLTTTLEDLTRWVLALRTGAVDGVAVTAAMAEPDAVAGRHADPLRARPGGAALSRADRALP